MIFILAFSAGCDSNWNWFRSEKKIKQQLEGTWRRIYLEITSEREFWTFSDGKIDIFRNDTAAYSFTIVCDTCTCNFPFTCPTSCCDNGLVDLNFKDGNDTIIIDAGNFSVDANLISACVITKDLTSTGESNYNFKWTIVELDERILYIVADKVDAAGIVVGNIQREFIKQ